MDIPLLVATVLARGATLGLDRAHHTFFYDYIPDPASAPHEVTPATQIAVPARSIVLVTM